MIEPGDILALLPRVDLASAQRVPYLQEALRMAKTKKRAQAGDPMLQAPHRSPSAYLSLAAKFGLLQQLGVQAVQLISPARWL